MRRSDAPVLFRIVCRNNDHIYIKFPYDSLNATCEEALKRHFAGFSTANVNASQ